MLSLVAVHGLNGDPIETWTHPKTKTFWLGNEDFLPRDVPGARIFTFGYNANACFGDSTTAEITDHAKDLMISLSDEREDDDVSNQISSCKGHQRLYVKSHNIRDLSYSLLIP